MPFGDLFGAFRGKREAAKPAKFQGAPGFALTGGYIVNKETNAQLLGANRWRTASDILANISIVAASVRYMLNLVARPAWRFEPAIEDSREADEAAEFAQEIIDGIEGSWTSTVRRMALYRYHGFGLHEWQAIKREDGRIGIGRIAVRPCHTVEKWDFEGDDLRGIVQRAPLDGKEVYLPRSKVIYLVDDSLTDSPEGMGWFRHLVEPANRLKNLFKIETMGFERDLNGIPVGRAPLSEINAMVGTALPNGTTFTQAMADSAISGLKNIVRMEAKEPGTGALIDSIPYVNQGADGETYTDRPMWDLELLSSDPNGLDAIAKAINRIQFEMALVMGTESMLVGREGEGSRALSEDKSRNLYLLGESTLTDMCEFIDRDLMGPVWAMNGLPEELKPKATTEGISFKDAEKIARVLKDMSTAGAVLAPDDPAINDLRDALNIPRAPELTEEERGILMGTKPDPNAPPPPGEEEEEEPDDGKPPPKKQGQGQASKFDPNQPRDRIGRWTETGAVEEGANDNQVVQLTRTAKQQFLVDPNKGKTLEQMRQEAFENQARLRDLALIVEEKAGVEFVEPPKGFEVKSMESLQRKIRDEGYDGPHEITDYSRASFVVDSPEEADAVVAALAEHGRIYDKGWKQIDEYGYLDRKVYMVHPNDGVSEIQVTPRGVFGYKMGQGHQLYEIARKASTPYVIARTAARKSRRKYNQLIRDEGFEGLGK